MICLLSQDEYCWTISPCLEIKRKETTQTSKIKPKHKFKSFHLNCQLIAENLGSLDGLLNKLHICLIAHITMFEILGVLCIRLKLYTWIWRIKLWQNYAMTRKYSAENIRKLSNSCASNYLHMHLWCFKTAENFILLVQFWNTADQKAEL